MRISDWSSDVCSSDLMHYARQGIIRPEMEFIAIRENARLEELRELHEAAGYRRSQHAGNNFGGSLQKLLTTELVRSEVASGSAIVRAKLNTTRQSIE